MKVICCVFTDGIGWCILFWNSTNKFIKFQLDESIFSFWFAPFCCYQHFFSVIGPCHDPLGLQSGALSSSQIHPSSTELGNSIDNIRLNSVEDDNGFMAWSPDAKDSDPTVTFDLGHVLQVTGLILQGESEEGSSFVKSFRVSFSIDNETYVNVSSNFNNVVRTFKSYSC